ncbi:MAG: helix-turn-helix transcriptional regulator [Syntrophales bacterium]
MNRRFSTSDDRDTFLVPNGLEDALRGPDYEKDKLSIPVNPVIHAGLRAIYAGGPKSRWKSDSFGRPLYEYETRAGRIMFSCAPPPDFTNRFHPSIAMYYTPRLGFIYSGALRDAVHRLSVETADIFLILMSRIACLQDPRTGIARISLDEMARFRGVNIRHGSARGLHEDFKREVLRLADLRLSMTWRDYSTGGTITFGKERPDRLLDILDIEYRRGGDAWTAFRFRCGQALSHFLDPEGLRWIGYYSRSLLHLNPYHDAFVKKLGTYWTMIGIVSGKKGSLPRATPKTILDFCGEEINWRRPGQTVDAFIEAHQKLMEIGVLDEIPVLEPSKRSKGYFKDWLDTVLTVKLSEHLWTISGRGRKARPRLKSRVRKKKSGQMKLPLDIPVTAQGFQDNPKLIRQLRADYMICQKELARALGVTRQTLSWYERGLRPLPADKAARILHIFRQESRPA